VGRVALFTVVVASVLAGCRGREDAASGPAPEASASSRHVRFVDMPPEGDVGDAVRRELSRAAGERRRVVVYVGAVWCEPCQRFHQAAVRGDLDATFPDLTLLEFDLDRDLERLRVAGYTSKYIPLFALPATNGSASGKQTEGGIKGEGAVAYMAPRLKALLGQ